MALAIALAVRLLDSDDPNVELGRAEHVPVDDSGPRPNLVAPRASEARAGTDAAARPEAPEDIEATPTAELNAEPTPEKVFHVLVVESSTDSPVANASIHRLPSQDPLRLPRRGEADARTDATGRTTLQAEPDVEKVNVAVQGAGWAPRLATITSTDPHAPDVVRLERGARLFGTAVGAPDGARVTLRANDYELYEATRDLTTFTGDGLFEAAIEGDGTYAAEGLPPHVRFDVALIGPNKRTPLRSVPDPVRLEEGESRELHFDLVAGARIVGHAVYEDGTDASGVEVQLVPSSIGRVGYVESYWEEVAAVRTDDAGRFTFEDVEPGRWIVGPEPRQSRTPSSERYAPVAVAVEVPDGAGDVPFRLELHRGLFIEGTVVGPDGEPRAAYVMARGKALGSGVSARAGDDGTFRVGPMAPGAVRVTARPKAPGNRPKDVSPSDPVDAVAGDTDVRVALRDGGVIEVRAVDPASGEAVPATFTLGSDGHLSLGFGFEESRTFSGIPVGVYSVAASTGDGRAGLVDGLDLRAGQQLNVDVPLAPGGTLRVRNDASVGTLGVTIFKDGWRVDGDGVHPGKEHVATLVPGEVTLELILRDWSSDAPVEMRRETRRAVVVAGETVDVVFGD